MACLPASDSVEGPGGGPAQTHGPLARPGTGRRLVARDRVMPGPAQGQQLEPCAELEGASACPLRLPVSQLQAQLRVETWLTQVMMMIL